MGVLPSASPALAMVLEGQAQLSVGVSSSATMYFIRANGPEGQIVKRCGSSVARRTHEASANEGRVRCGKRSGRFSGESWIAGGLIIESESAGLLVPNSRMPEPNRSEPPNQPASDNGCLGSVPGRSPGGLRSDPVVRFT